MKRTKEWWACLNELERSELVMLERGARQPRRYSVYIPDGCSACGYCGTPHLGSGLCPLCSERLDDLIQKANGVSANSMVDDSIVE